MRHQITYFFLLLTTCFVYVNSEGCLIEDRSEELCPETEYLAYVECLQYKKRMKRSVCNSEPCNECNCSYCEKNECSEMCNNCCEISFDTCETSYCCYKKCHSKCDSGECRRSCRKSCQSNISERKKVVVQEESAQSPNITTVINLHNQINNTNILDIPIKIETKNINNITLEAADLNVQNDQGFIEAVEHEEFVEKNNSENNIEVTTENIKNDDNMKQDEIKSEDDNCCQIISPRQCVPQNQFPFIKCFHYRQQVCGNICQAKIMHTQTHQICDENPLGPPECHNQIIYIPQPQPRCTYLDTWPYVSCNIQSMDTSYNVGPFAQSFGQYPYGQYPNQFGSYQNLGYNFNQYNPQSYPLPYGMENFYSVSKNVDGTNVNYENLFDKKEVIDFSQGNYISETIPIEVNQLKSEHIEPELVRVEVESKPYQKVQNKDENETI